MEIAAPNISKLRDFYESSIVAKAFLNHAATRERDQSETKVDLALRLLRSDGFNFRRRDVIDLFRKLEELGCGRFVEGRHGRPSRFVWSVGLRNVAKAATGDAGLIDHILTEGQAAGLPEPVREGDDDEATAATSVEELEERDPEGLDEPRTIGWGDYPLDSVFVRNEQRTVGEVVRRIRAGRYDLNPDFQREFLWPQDKQSRLIESCLMRLPLPVFYVAEAPDGKIVVVDGLQRLSTFRRFLDNELRLRFPVSDEDNSATMHALQGLRFQDLPLNLQERVEDTQLTLYVLDAKAPDRAKLDIFERVNSGEPLTRQQMRNCLYNGPATHWLREAAASEAFQVVTGGTLDSKKMRDREAINRFCAFRSLGWQSYRTGEMDSFLAECLTRMNSMAEADLSALRSSFDRAMLNNFALFDRHAFRKSLAQPSGNRSVLNIALFDVCSTLLCDAPEELVTKRREKIYAGISTLLTNESFQTAITYATNGTKQVQTRFAMMERTIAEALSD
jgi:hypothetical protein